jgi:hypothetical protein
MRCPSDGMFFSAGSSRSACWGTTREQLVDYERERLHEVPDIRPVVNVHREVHLFVPQNINLLSPVKEHHQFQVDGRVLIRLAHRARPVSCFGFSGSWIRKGSEKNLRSDLIQ